MRCNNDRQRIDRKLRAEDKKPKKNTMTFRKERKRGKKKGKREEE
jgi:hypothetical protein